ncbi:Uncharacterised protein [Starkeya nomas]|uniref:Peptidoglycan binding-like domain-containing protein n=1 Tax=Starkeya nomas TaxID=2666134 RepID=A0A5S9NC02_9HYPH|nr:peptidoglycan-binding protein [Starkeya nomas]CAA0086966.1 Uncharacterised protein [Starkeya nomas]
MRTAVSIVREVAPGAAPALVTALSRASELKAAGLTTPLRLAHFLAQIAVETQNFSQLRESGRYTAKRIVEVFGVGKHSAAIPQAEAAKLAGNEYALFERVYGVGNAKKAKTLGNVYPGDGYKFRGGGAMHTTGRRAYAAIGLEANPDLIVTAEHCLRAALAYWAENGCNHLADINDARSLTKRINGGYNAYDRRVSWFNRLWELLRADEDAPESWAAAQASPHTRLLQERLVQLGYDIKIDGRYGPKTTAAIVAFQKANGVKADGIAGDVTLAAIEARINETAPAIGSPAVPEPPSAAKPAATGLSVVAVAEGGQKLVDQAGLLKEYSSLSDWVGYGAMFLTAIGVTIVAVGVIRTYVIPALWPATAPVPA